MTTPHYQDDMATLYHGDCLDVLAQLPDASIDAIVTDPPYGIGFMGKDWDQPRSGFGSRVRRHKGARSLKAGPTGVDSRRTTERGAAMEAGRYDLSPHAMLNFQHWVEAWATECLRVLKPGGHMLAFGGSRTWHRLASGIEDAPLILEHRAPGVPNLGDITAVDWAAVEPVDIIDGGSPCQDISTAGRRAGMTTGTRSNLWVAMRDGVPHLRALGRVLGDLASLGFDAEWRSLRAADIGAPHGRYRVFVVAAHPERVARLQRRLPAPGETTSGRALGTTPRGDRALVDLLPTPKTTDNRAHSAADMTRHDPGLRAIASLLPTPTTQPGTGNGHARTLTAELLLTPRATDGTQGGPNQRGSSGDLMLPSATQDMGRYTAAITRWGTALGRPAPAALIPGTTRLNPRFVEWMMGLPAGWVTDIPGLTRNQQLHALGNGVVPQQAHAAILDCLTAPTERPAT